MPSERFTITLDDGAETVIRHHPRPGTTRLYISHGNGFAVDGYRVFWEPLLADFDVVLFDMRNHGESPSTGADGHHYQQMARDLTTVHARVEDRLGKSTAVDVFHSMSSRAAMKNAVDFGSPYDALVLYDPPSVPPRDHALYEAMRTFELKLVSWAAERPERFGSPDELEATYAQARASAKWLPQARADMARTTGRVMASGIHEGAIQGRSLSAPPGVEIEPVPVPVEPRDPRPERGKAERHGIAERAGRHRPRHRLPRYGGRRRAGLADLHVDDRAPRRLRGPRRLHDVHHNEGIDLAPA